MSKRNENGIVMNKAFRKLFLDGITELQAKIDAGADMEGWTYVYVNNSGRITLKDAAKDFAATNWPQPRKIASFKAVNPELSTFTLVRGISTYRARFFHDQIFIERFDGAR